MGKIGTKATIITMVIIVAIVGIILLSLMNMTKVVVNDMLLQLSESANNAFAHMLQNYQDEALQRAEMIAGSNDVVDAVSRGDYDALRAALNNFSAGLDLITLCDAQGVVLARTHSDNRGDSVLTQQAISVALNTGKGISLIEPGTVIGLSTRGSAAIKDQNGTIIGALTCGHDLSQSKYIDEVKAQNNCEATFFAGDTRMSTTLVDESGNRAVDTKASDSVIQTVINSKEDFNGRIELFGLRYSVYYSPVIINDQAIGMLFTGVNIEKELRQERNMIIMISIAVIMLLLAVLLTVWTIRTTSNKAHWYESMLDSIPLPISVTDMNMNWTFINKPVEQMLKVKRSEVRGKHCSTWGAGICNTANCGITCLKNNKATTFFEQMGADFRVDTSYLYDSHGNQAGHIEVVQDITKMVATQKAQTEMVQGINQMSNAFVQASQQISNVAQELAQGSAEQSSSIEELSAAVSEVAQQTKENEGMASRAVLLAETIKKKAETGSHRMDEMMSAVREINEASKSINKVIKVIDDIAFQTNILALNAAVEAARAGQYGKGFSVVAEEVRNLAGKSAQAAKDTGALIENSMAKASLGSKIASETAESFAEIVTGINESNVIVNNIAKSSIGQSLEIGQIEAGITQVAEIVQQNTAIAEESAAASEELSGQTNVLSDLLDKFHAKNGLG